jgi:prepilin-type N-terminal cleavage/methylation domain-containing protein
MKRAFTLIELIVVIAIIAALMALILPVTRLVREQGAEAVCQAHLREMALILKTYGNDHDSLFPHPSRLYHSKASLAPSLLPLYPRDCRWHDAEIGLESPLMRQEHKEYQGDLVPYLGDPKILLCKTGARANRERGCNNDHVPRCDGREIPIVPQYTYTMNWFLGWTLTFRTGKTRSGSPSDALDLKTVRETEVRKETQVTRSPSEVFVFGEENSWAINPKAKWPAPYHLSCLWRPRNSNFTGAITSSALEIRSSYRIPAIESVHERVTGASLLKEPDISIGSAFATYHRPHQGDLNTGHSYVSLLDGHVQKVTVADQLRRSRRTEGLPASRLGPGGNLSLAWPLDVPPPAGWENQ